MLGDQTKFDRERHNRGKKTKTRNFNRVWLSIETVLLAAVILTFNILTLDIGYLGFVISAAEPNSFVPLIAPGIRPLVPWINLWLGVAFVINLVNLLRGRWHPLTRLADLGSGIVGICVLAATLLISPALALEPVWAAEQAAAGLSLEPLESMLLPVVNGSLFIGIVIALVSLLAATTRKTIYLVRFWSPQEPDLSTALHFGIGLATALALCGPFSLIFDEIFYLVLALPFGLALGFFINRQFSESRI